MKVSLPPPSLPWRGHEHIEEQARLYLDALGLHDWRFIWDRAVRRLGSCQYAKRCISLSAPFVQHYLPHEQEHHRIDRTLRHELAHALAMTHHKARGHGAVWKHYCAQLGIGDETPRTRCDDFTSAHPTAQNERKPRYALVLRGTGEVIREYYNRPRRGLGLWADCYLPGRQEETLGKLELILL